MIEVPILKETRSFKTYLIGHFTTRQVVCGLIAVAGIYFSYTIQTKVIGLESPIGFFMFIFAIPGVLFGWITPYGLTFEKFLKTVWIDNFVAPKLRPYKIENPIHDLLKEDQENNKEKKEKPKKIKKKDLPAEWISAK